MPKSIGYEDARGILTHSLNPCKTGTFVTQCLRSLLHANDLIIWDPANEIHFEGCSGPSLTSRFSRPVKPHWCWERQPGVSVLFTEPRVAETKASLSGLHQTMASSSRFAAQVHSWETGLVVSLLIASRSYDLCVGWLFNAPAACECISGSNLLRFRATTLKQKLWSNLLSHPVTKYWHWAKQP